MNSSGFASVTIVPRRVRRRRASLTLYGNPLHQSQSHLSPDRQADVSEDPSARHSFAERAPVEDAGGDADALLQAIDRVQSEARRDATLSQALSPSDLDLVVDSIVRELWHGSPIKTFVPVLALRQTRDRIINARQ